MKRVDSKRLDKIKKIVDIVGGIVSVCVALGLIPFGNAQANVDSDTSTASADPSTPAICRELEEFEDNETRLAYAADLLGAGEYRATVMFLSDFLVTVEPNSHLATAIYYDRGLAHLYLKEYHQAILDLSSVVEQVEFPDAYYNLGNAHLRLDDYEEALANYEHAQSLEKKPEYEDAMNIAKAERMPVG